jgi:hypothetical protein
MATIVRPGRPDSMSACVRGKFFMEKIYKMVQIESCICKLYRFSGQPSPRRRPCLRRGGCPETIRCHRRSVLPTIRAIERQSVNGPLPPAGSPYCQGSVTSARRFTAQTSSPSPSISGCRYPALSVLIRSWGTP